VGAEHLTPVRRRYSQQGITAYSVHPGIIVTPLYRTAGMATVFVQTLGYPWTKSVAQGASTQVYTATSPDVLNGGEGQYFQDNAVVPSVVQGIKAGEAAKLWTWTEELIASKTV
jgi:NAD(P)-dependent dehydrogenase (short-subunit alcohol dehydrogenase family)